MGLRLAQVDIRQLAAGEIQPLLIQADRLSVLLSLQRQIGLQPQRLGVINGAELITGQCRRQMLAGLGVLGLDGVKVAKKAVDLRLLDRAFGGAVGPLVQHLLGGERIAAKDRAALRAIAEEAPRSPRTGKARGSRRARK